MKRRLVILLLLALLTVAAAVAVRYRSCFFATSEVFRRYEHAQGIEADYIRNYPVNDTLRLDITILVAKDSCAFVKLLKEWNTSEDVINMMFSVSAEKDSRTVRASLKNHPEMPSDTINMGNNDVRATFPQRRTIAFFHTTDESQIIPLLYAHFSKTIDIN